MGHERVGYLPKSQKWRVIVEQISDFTGSGEEISDIASGTLKNVRHRFNHIEEDPGVIAAFRYLVLLAYSSKLTDPSTYLKSKGISLEPEFTIYDLALSIQSYVNEQHDSREYSVIAVQSMIDTVSDWVQKNDIQKTLVFEGGKNSFQPWVKAADGKGFCELSRTFFGKFTERYLRYYLEREATSRIQSLTERDQFNKQLESHIGAISIHAFETAKIMQSLSAGWFNKVRHQSPSERDVRGFLAFSFKKINSELLREENAG